MCGFFFQAEDGIRDRDVTGVQTCALPICTGRAELLRGRARAADRPADPRTGRGGPHVPRAARRGRGDRAVELQIGRASCRERVWGTVAAGSCTETYGGVECRADMEGGGLV